MAARGPHNPAITWKPYTRVAWGGTLGAEGEVWTNSLKFDHFDNSVLTVEQATAAGPPVWAALKAFHQNTRNMITSQAKMTWLKLNAVGVQGLQAAGATNVYAEAAVPGLGATTVPLYQTLAISLRAETKRGRAHIGRIFPPCVVGGLDTNGRFLSVDTDGFALAFKNCLQAMQLALRTATGTVGNFTIMSPGNTAKGTAPISGMIISVEVDSVPDVQHRRTNKLPRRIGAVALLGG